MRDWNWLSNRLSLLLFSLFAVSRAIWESGWRGGGAFTPIILATRLIERGNVVRTTAIIKLTRAKALWLSSTVARSIATHPDGWARCHCRWIYQLDAASRAAWRENGRASELLAPCLEISAEVSERARETCRASSAVLGAENRAG